MEKLTATELSITKYGQKINAWAPQKTTRELSEGKFGPKKNFTQIPNRIIDDVLMSAKEKIVLITLFRHSYNKGVCEPYVATLERETGIRRKTIFSILKSLEKQCYITGHRRHGKSTLYKLSSLGN